MRTWPNSISAGVKNGIKAAQMNVWLPFLKTQYLSSSGLWWGTPAIADHLVSTILSYRAYKICEILGPRDF